MCAAWQCVKTHDRLLYLHAPRVLHCLLYIVTHTYAYTIYLHLCICVNMCTHPIHECAQSTKYYLHRSHNGCEVACDISCFRRVVLRPPPAANCSLTWIFMHLLAAGCQTMTWPVCLQAILDIKVTNFQHKMNFTLQKEKATFLN